MSSERAIFRGIIVPLVTPLDAGGSVDVHGLKRLLGHVVRGHVDGVLLLGSTGEGVSLRKDEKKEVVKRGVEVCSNLKGGVPVIVGAMDCAESEALEMIDWAAECGADAVLCNGPFYYKVDEGTLGRSMERLADQSKLPMMIYHYPTLTGNVLTEAVLNDLFEHPNVIGMKDSSGDMSFLESVLRVKGDREDVVILVGPDVLLYPAMMAGADGGVPGGANIFPNMYSDLAKAVIHEHHDRAKLLHRQIVDIALGLYGDRSCAVEVVRSLKAAAAMMGMCNETTAVPISLADWDARVRIQTLMREQGLVM